MFSWYGSRLQYAPGYFKELQEKILESAISEGFNAIPHTNNNAFSFTAYCGH